MAVSAEARHVTRITPPALAWAVTLAGQDGMVVSKVTRTVELMGPVPARFLAAA